MRERSLRILVVDDEPAMVGVIGGLVGAAGHRIVAAYDGDEAVRRFREERPDVVLLDLAMPGLDGAAVCHRIRDESDVPILVVSGETDATVTVELLDAGADDYVRKPFSGDELLARIRAVTRRRPRRPGRGPWTIDPARHELRWRDEPLALTAIEVRLAACLVERAGEIVEADELMAAAWPGVASPDRSWLKPHLARLRAKLRAAGAPEPVAVRGAGYRIDATSARPGTSTRPPVTEP
ncbi:MAG TPA: response regulator transcription factor [Candidatus Limnocylindrales bacterium]